MSFREFSITYYDCKNAASTCRNEALFASCGSGEGQACTKVKSSGEEEEELYMDISSHDKIQPIEADLRAFEEMQKNTQEEIHGKLAVSIARLANVIE